jgi:hypothetical protein
MAITYVDVWKNVDAKAAQDALAFWHRENAMPPGEKAEDRVKELAYMAYDDDRLIALTTVQVQDFPQLRQKFGFMRMMVASGLRMQHMSHPMSDGTKAALEKYALAHPEENIAGLAAIFQANGTGKYPNSRGGGLVLIGYTAAGYQIRCSWFDHFRVPANKPDYIRSSQ